MYLATVGDSSPASMMIRSVLDRELSVSLPREGRFGS